MSEESLGSGLYLDRNFDLAISNNGDLRKEDGLEELSKDISFQLAAVLEPLLGQPDRPNFEVELKDTTREVILSDSRVDAVGNDDIVVNDVSDELSSDVTYEIVVPTVVASGESQELVFTV